MLTSVADFHGPRARHLLALIYHPLSLSKLPMALYQLRDSLLHSGVSSKEQRLFNERTRDNNVSGVILADEFRFTWL
jgi:hypothetical protein